MIKKKEMEGLTQVFTAIFKELKKQGIPIKKAKLVEEEPFKPKESIYKGGDYIA